MPWDVGCPGLMVVYLLVILSLCVDIYALSKFSNCTETPVFLHIPKNAGSVVERYERQLYGLVVRKERWASLGGWNKNPFPEWYPPEINCNPHHLPPRYFPKNPQENPYYKRKIFCVLRDPLDRWVSEYCYSTHEKWPPKDANKIKSWTMKMLDQLEGANMSMTPLSDCHFIPQSTYVFNDDEGKHSACDTRIRFDRFDQEMNALMLKLGTQCGFEVPPALFNRRDTKIYGNKRRSDRPLQSQTKMEKQAEYESLLGPEFSARINSLYKADYDLLGEYF